MRFDPDDPDAPRRADRRAAQLLVDPRYGRLRDTAVLAGAKPTPTTGHHPADPHPDREIDKIYGTQHFSAPGAVVASEVVDTEQAKKLSDHLPKIATVEPHAIAANTPTS